MNLELFRALTPWISFLLLLGLGTIGWLIRWMLAENLRRFRDFKENLEDIESSLRDLERVRQDDQKYLFENIKDINIYKGKMFDKGKNISDIVFFKK